MSRKKRVNESKNQWDKGNTENKWLHYVANSMKMHQTQTQKVEAGEIGREAERECKVYADEA